MKCIKKSKEIQKVSDKHENMKVDICTELFFAPTATIDLPIKSWSDIKEWFVKWDTLHYTVDGDKWEEIPLNNDSPDAVDWKRPINVTVSNPETGEVWHDDED
jgi:hypothetical protein